MSMKDIAEEEAEDQRLIESIEREIDEQRALQSELAARIQQTSDQISQLQFKRTSIVHRLRQRRDGSREPSSLLGTDKKKEDILIEWDEPTFAWMDSGYGKANVSIYITEGIRGVGKLPAGQVTCEFSERTFDLRIRGLEDKSYCLKRTLYAYISPERSSFRVTANQIHLHLVKRDSSKTWPQLHKKWKALEDDDNRPVRANPDDPIGGLWNMMQEMYTDGDDNTKSLMNKAIYQAAQEARKEGQKEGFTGAKQVGKQIPAPSRRIGYPPGPPSDKHGPIPGQHITPKDRVPGYGGKKEAKKKPPPPPPPPVPM
eukprot:CAMPEP_0167745704 /NCGR_PEP_ID=MMETSP0110_2-20121227/3302_1 /TAXON_ID=629695 /ORGANISM="Gymnochlora sp., Strain CCMP2014" /LENGTH=313 /DNA_ID=CAMNT_0007630381 /DNA_START=202 /DNA_END=1143 /DNA_ORIENTATION=+